MNANKITCSMILVDTSSGKAARVEDTDVTKDVPMTVYPIGWVGDVLMVICDKAASGVVHRGTMIQCIGDAMANEDGVLTSEVSFLEVFDIVDLPTLMNLPVLGGE